MFLKTAVRIISLEASTDRRQSFAHMAAGAKLAWEFFPACTGVTQPLSYDAGIATRRCGRPLSPSEIGCYASHFKLWEWLANSEYDQAIILEDDVIVDWDALAALADHKFADDGINLLRLYSTHPFERVIARYRLLSPHSHLVRATSVLFGTQGYVLTKAAARTLVSKYAVAAAPLDWVLGRYWEHGIANYCMISFPVIERYAPSTIGAERHVIPVISSFNRVARLAWRLLDRVRRAYAECCVMRKGKWGPLRDSGAPLVK